MDPERYYVVLGVVHWEDVVVLGVPVAEIGMPDKVGIGLLPAFETEEELRKHYPDRRYIVLERPQKHAEEDTN